MNLITPATMSVVQEQRYRDQAFYLLKKYTSWTFLDYARKLYQAFIDAHWRLMTQPTAAMLNYEYAEVNFSELYMGEHKEFLRAMIPLEEGLEMLLEEPLKEAAYRKYLEMVNPGFNLLQNRFSHERGTWEDPMYIELGINPQSPTNFGESYEPLHSRYFQGVVDAVSISQALYVTAITNYDPETVTDTSGILPFILLDTYSKRRCARWTYERLFFDPPWPLPREFPAALSACPPHNDNKEGQVWSGEEIPVTGIWEPWFVTQRYTGKEPGPHSGWVGCPNYFLAGQTAIRYNIEGTTEFEDVRWRLLWKDERYLDGKVPTEEADYLPQQERGAQETAPPPLSALPGEPCPKTGLWFAPHLDRKKLHITEGEPMPGPEVHPQTRNGVIWYFQGE